MREQDPSAAAATTGAATAIAEGQGSCGGQSTTGGQLHAGQDAAAVDTDTGHTGHDTAAAAARLWMLLGGRSCAEEEEAERKAEEEEDPYPCTPHIAATVAGLSSHCTSSSDVHPSSTPKSTGERLWLELGGLLLEFAALPVAVTVAAGAIGSGVGARKARRTIHGDNTGMWCPFICVANRDRRSAYRPRASSHRDCSTASNSSNPSTP
jgi:hypothetical protein